MRNASVEMAVQNLPRIISPTLLSYIHGHPNLPLHSWYFIAGVTLSVLNRPDEISTVFKYAMEKGGDRIEASPGHDEKLKIARRMREALVKAAPIGGLPKVSIILKYPQCQYQETKQKPCSCGRQSIASLRLKQQRHWLF